jgi:hypothetical protein
MKAEVKWRYLATRGLAFEDAKAEAERMREQKIAADNGGTTLSMSPEPASQFIELDNLPDNSWSL